MGGLLNKPKPQEPEAVPPAAAGAAEASEPPPPPPVADGGGRADDEATGAPAAAAAAERAFSLAALEAEVAELRGDLPAYVSAVAPELTVPHLVCNNAGDLEAPREGEGPWDLIATVRGDDTNEAYNFDFRVRLRFDTRWPANPPQVRFQCIIHHALIDDENGMLLPFYRTLPTGEGADRHTVRMILQAVHDFLVSPLRAWGIEESQAPKKLLQSLSANERLQTQRLSTLRRYAEQTRHPELFGAPKLRQEWFDPAVWTAYQAGTAEAWRGVLTEELPGEVFSFRLFTDAFCEMLVEEIFNFYASGLPAKRPNSMNNYGIILDEIGLELLIDELQRLLQPIGDLHFRGAGSLWDGHHCFIVRYREGEDLGLDMHVDDSDVTFNICLGLDFAGAGLQFCGVMGKDNHRKRSYTYQHRKGVCVCHLGRKRHGADDITTGERLNLILWNHSSTYRASDEYQNPPYVKEAGAPDAVCVSYTHDRDFGNFKEYPKGKEEHRGRGWCPPKPFEYEDFKPDAAVEKLGS
eukprot:TRINITY_DN11454_c0_g1_i3.p1 TRINITY_DN11454_c0_g1~~TRINITY_DN11454_c0_g1_i3.p1  ORF type:complete len:522 (-),score=136.21 TRINITY_DN11454_c0_g1_i3:93-1658(-)